MAQLDDIREGLAANLRAIPGCQVSPYLLDNPTGPALQVVGPNEIDYDTAFGRGGDSWLIAVEGCAPGALDKGSQIMFDRWLESSGDLSVKQAIEADRTLGGKVADLRVTRFSGYSRQELPSGGNALIGEWTVQVETSG